MMTTKGANKSIGQDKKPLYRFGYWDIVVLAVAGIAILPVVLRGQNAIIPVHDSLDAAVAWVQMLKQQGLLLALNQPTNCLGQMSSAYFAAVFFGLLNVLNVFFDVFTAHMISYALNIIIGYFSMYLLLTLWIENEGVVKLAAIAFAVLPVFPGWYFAATTVPLCWYLFCKMKTLAYNKWDARVLLLLFFPVLSSFVFIGLFMLGIWLLAIAVLWVKEKRLYINLLAGWVALTVGYVIVDLKTFMAAFFLSEPLNRSVFTLADSSFGVFLRTWVRTFLSGFYHDPPMQQMLILPLLFIALCMVGIYLLGRKLDGKLHPQKQAQYLQYFFHVLALVFVAGIFAFLYAANYYTPIKDFFARIVPFLGELNWGRVLFLNNVIWYVCFAFTLALLAKQKHLAFLAYALAIAQIVIIFVTPETYNYANYNLFYQDNISTHVTFREFYAEDLFGEIKRDIDYHGEGAAMVGAHPSVLMYNGFVCVDGYNNSYPLAYMMAFREVIAPQLEHNPEDQRYYDKWGGRMYLYCDDAPYAPTREKITTPVQLYIDTDAYRRLGGVYIFSRAELGNADDLELDLVRTYIRDDSIYDIYVYKVRP